jgi:hypothetical protein
VCRKDSNDPLGPTVVADLLNFIADLKRHPSARQVKSAPGLPQWISGEIEMREVPDFPGAPEEIRTPDPQIRITQSLLRPKLGGVEPPEL